MPDKMDYFSHSMNEIVFEKRNKDYGAFLLREIYSKNLSKALAITALAFILGTSTPFIIRYFGLFKENDIEVLDMTVFVLDPPPSINPLEPPKPPPPRIEEVKRPTEKFIELEAAKEKDLIEPPPPTIEELDKKDIADHKSDEPPAIEPPLKLDDLTSGRGVNGDGKVWNKVEQAPEFIGGEDAYFQFMGSHLIYPEKEKGDGIEGVVRVYFVINSDGTISDARVLKSSGNKHLDAEAIRLISSQPAWKPGKQNGEAVRVKSVTDIEFRLN